MQGKRIQKIGMSLSLLALPLLMGCALIKKPSLPVVPEIDSAEVLLKKLREGSGRVHSLKALAKIRLKLPEGKYRFSEVVIAQEPRRIRMETLSFFGQLVSLLVTDSSRLQALFLTEGCLYEGTASAHNLSLFLPVPLTTDEIVSLLLGKAFLIDFDLADLEFQRESNLYILKLSSLTGGKTQRLWVDPISFQIVRSETFSPGKITLVSTEFANFKELNEVWFPSSISIQIPSEAIEVKVKYRNLELNPVLDLSLFTIIPPPGITLVELD